MSKSLGWLPAPLHRLALRLAHRLRHFWRSAARRPLAGVSVIATDGAGRVLLVRHSYGSRRWALPGGGIKRGEAPEAAARREVREELGCDVTGLVLIATRNEIISGARHTAFVYAGALDGEARPDRREVIEARLFAPDGLPGDLGELSRRRLEAWAKLKQR